MEIRFEKRTNDGVDMFNIVKVNAKEGDVTFKTGLKYHDPLHILSEFNYNKMEWFYKAFDANSVTQFLDIS